MDTEKFIEAFTNAIKADKIADDSVINNDFLFKTLKEVVREQNITREIFMNKIGQLKDIVKASTFKMSWKLILETTDINIFFERAKEAGILNSDHKLSAEKVISQLNNFDELSDMDFAMRVSNENFIKTRKALLQKATRRVEKLANKLFPNDDIDESDIGGDDDLISDGKNRKGKKRKKNKKNEGDEEPVSLKKKKKKKNSEDNHLGFSVGSERSNFVYHDKMDALFEQYDAYKIEASYSYDVKLSDDYETSMTFACSAFADLLLSNDNKPALNHITSIIGIIEVIDEIVYVYKHLELLGDPRVENLKSILFLIPNNLQPSKFGESILQLLNASIPVDSPKLWKIATTVDGSTYLDGLVYGDDDDDEMKDVRQLMMFMRDDQSVQDEDCENHQTPNMTQPLLGYKFIDESILHKLNEGGSHALPKHMIEKIFDIWHYNKLIKPTDSVYEIGMGAPVLAFSFGGFFKNVVATDTDLEIYSNAVSFLESLSSAPSSENSFNADVKATHKNPGYKKPSFAPAEKGTRKSKKKVLYSTVHDISDEDSQASSSSPRKRRTTSSTNNEEEPSADDEYNSDEGSNYTTQSSDSSSDSSSDHDE